MNRHTTRLFFFVASLFWVAAGTHLFLYQLNPTWASWTDDFFGAAENQLHQVSYMPEWVTVQGLVLTAAIFLVLLAGVFAVAYTRKGITPSSPAFQSEEVTISHVVLQQLWEREAMKVKSIRHAAATVASGKRNKPVWRLTADLDDVTVEERVAAESHLQEAVTRVQNAIGTQVPAVLYVR